MHREVMSETRHGIKIDHINHDTLDNTKANLRAVSTRQNASNLRTKHKKSSKFVGVTFVKRLGKWMASMKFNGKSIHIGYFHEEESAARAYQEAVKNSAFDAVARPVQ